MASKENKGGILKNEDIERERERTGAAEREAQGYHGSQDNGDHIVRTEGSPTQQKDGAGEEDASNNKV